MTIYLSKTERAALFAAHGHKCFQCGASNRRLVAHHTSYSKKPDVVLCQKCHMILHRKPGAPNKSEMTGTSEVLARLPVSLHERLKAQVARTRRSINSELIVALEDYLLRQEFERERMARTTETSHA